MLVNKTFKRKTCSEETVEKKQHGYPTPEEDTSSYQRKSWHSGSAHALKRWSPLKVTDTNKAATSYLVPYICKCHGDPQVSVTCLIHKVTCELQQALTPRSVHSKMFTSQTYIFSINTKLLLKQLQKTDRYQSTDIPFPHGPCFDVNDSLFDIIARKED